MKNQSKKLLFLVTITCISQFSGIAQLPSWLPPNGLIAWYSFDGNTTDSSANRNDGTVINTISYTTDHLGRTNSAAVLGSGRIVTNQTMFNFNYNSAFSISFWVLDKGSASGRLVSTECPEGSFRISTYGNGVYAFQFGSSANYLYDTLQLNTWYHMTYVYDKRNVRLHKNGVLVKTVFNNDNENLKYCAPFTIGAKASASYDSWNGAIDELALYNRSLSSSEINNIYAESNKPVDTTIQNRNLLAWYSFNGNTQDSSGYKNHLLPNNINYVTDRFGNENSAISFDGLTSYCIANPSSSLQPTSYTISCWIFKERPLSAKSYSTIIAYSPKNWTWGTPYKIQLEKSNTTQVTTLHWSSLASWQYMTSNAELIDSGKWYHVVVSFDSLTGKHNMYVNDTLISSRTSVLSYANNPINGLFLGATSESLTGSLAEFYKGKLDDIRIYSRALDSTEIKTLYNEGGYESILPLQITNMQAIRNNQQVVISWQTANEMNTANFVVERSSNGNSFSPISFVTAKSSGNNSYTFADVAPNSGNNYYRLQMVDKDGSYTYSKTVEVAVAGSSPSFTIAPNPAKSFATLGFSTNINNATIAVYNLVGKKVWAQTVKTAIGSYRLATQNLPTGVYVVEVVTANNKQQQKLVVGK